MNYLKYMSTGKIIRTNGFMRKIRTKNHVIAELAANHFEQVKKVFKLEFGGSHQSISFSEI